MSEAVEQAEAKLSGGSRKVVEAAAGLLEPGERVKAVYRGTVYLPPLTFLLPALVIGFVSVFFGAILVIAMGAIARTRAVLATDRNVYVLSAGFPSWGTVRSIESKYPVDNVTVTGNPFWLRVGGDARIFSFPQTMGDARKTAAAWEESAAVPREQREAATDGANILEASGVSKAFGGLVAVSGVDFAIPRHGIVSIIGPNGAGKTTFFNMLTGLYKPTRGRISFNGRNMTGVRPDRILAAGVARTFQNIRLFATMTALENVMIGEHARMRAGLFGSMFRPPGVVREERAVREKAREMLTYVGLKEQSFDQLAINLAYGDQRRVEIARALASNPQLLLLDEPTAGMNPQESAALTDFMRRLRDDLGITILLIEHDMKVVMGVSEYITVLDHGEKIAEGVPQEVRDNPRVIEAYLGKQEEE